MIPRYARSEMVKIWSEESKYQTWLDIETYATQAQEQLGLVPKGTTAAIRKKAKFNVEKIAKIEATVKHDVIAFLTNVAESVGAPARFLHQGMTSSDVLDTCLAVQLNQSADILIADLKTLLASIKKRALEHKNTLTIGRSHGIHAEPTTIGLKFATFYAEFDRNLKRLQQAQKEIATCAISGAVGTYANIDPRVQSYVAKKMGLTSEPISTQVIPRDRHAMFFSTLAVIASSIEHMATEIRHLQRTEVREAEEFFAKGQKGSSAMPHKRNPVLTENLTGLARMIRSYALPALENVALWHERDISHSSVERYIGPDACITLDFALARLNDVVKNLVIYPENCDKNLNQLKGLIFSQRVLLALIEAGMSREQAYELVQTNAMQVWAKDKNFLDLLKADKHITKVLPPQKLASLFDMTYHTKHVNTIFKAVFGKK